MYTEQLLIGEEQRVCVWLRSRFYEYYVDLLVGEQSRIGGRRPVSILKRHLGTRRLAWTPLECPGVNKNVRKLTALWLESQTLQYLQ